MNEAASEGRALPTSVGRFRIVGHVATGGMAEILLAAADGAQGFTRPVVIKRVLPHLAKELEFRKMFVDEARILATLRHANLVTVEELGEEDDALYLVMEYLDGEGLDALVRALRHRKERVPPALAAYIVAEACAGLHAAHEHHDVEGRPLEIVHRDVSPQNVFLTYAGTVKVIDFGIAKAANRETKTETGTVKGKFAYMSPEQIEGSEVDRRTDVFALGVVLHELLTGRRLFQRSNHLEIVRAICLAPTPRPTEWQPDVPPELDAIVMRALSKSKGERQASALVLREELLAALDHLPDRPGHQPRVLADLLEELFVERRKEKTSMLAQVAMGDRIARTGSGSVSGSQKSPTDQKAAPSGPSRAWMLGLALGVMTVIGVSVAWRDGRTEAPPVEPDSIPPVVVAPLDAPVVAPDAGAPAPEVIHLSVASIPPAAILTLDGREIGPTPIDVPIDRGSTALSLRLTAEGYRSLERELVPDVDQRLELTLTRLPRGARPPTPVPPRETPARSPFERVD